jgi:hypothetical protein
VWWVVYLRNFGAKAGKVSGKVLCSLGGNPPKNGQRENLAGAIDTVSVLLNPTSQASAQQQVHHDGAPVDRHYVGAEANNDLDDDVHIPHSHHGVSGRASSAY